MSQSNMDGKKTRTRKRDRFRQLLGIHPRSSSPASSDAITGASTSDLESVSAEAEAESLWAQALNSMSEKDKGTLRGLSGKDKWAPEGNDTTPNLDIEELLVAVRAKREICLENQWEFEFRGRAVNLRDQADKIISWLAKFKEVGDIAIQQDPSHAALPWAGIRFLLQVCRESLLPRWPLTAL